jgi:hypothetical protein
MPGQLSRIQLTNTGMSGATFVWLTRLQRQKRTGPWEPKSHSGIKEELILTKPLALHLFGVPTNLTPFLRNVEQISGYPPLTRFHGRVHRMIPTGEHYDSWHWDIDDDEGLLVGMSLNLTAEPYAGVVVQMRYRETQKGFAEVPKTAFAGWFRNQIRGFVHAFSEANRAGRPE